MPPISWSNETCFLGQILPLFNKYNVVLFNRTDSRLANNGIPLDLQRLRCRVNSQGLKFTSEIETLGQKLVQILQRRGPFVALHLRYEMDILAFSGCTHGCSQEETKELKRLRYAYPWWREKRWSLKRGDNKTAEEAALILQALGFDNKTNLYCFWGNLWR